MVAITLRVMIRPKDCDVVSGQALGPREPRAATGGDRQQTVGNQPIDREVALNLPASELIVGAGIICVKTAPRRSVSRRALSWDSFTALGASSRKSDAPAGIAEVQS